MVLFFTYRNKMKYEQIARIKNELQRFAERAAEKELRGGRGSKASRKRRIDEFKKIQIDAYTFVVGQVLGQSKIISLTRILREDWDIIKSVVSCGEAYLRDDGVPDYQISQINDLMAYYIEWRDTGNA